MRRVKAAAVLAVLLTLPAAPAHSQRADGEATGTVQDSSGAVLPGATVTLTNEGTGIVRTVVTNGSGLFVFVNVPPGT